MRTANGGVRAASAPRRPASGSSSAKPRKRNVARRCGGNGAETVRQPHLRVRQDDGAGMQMQLPDDIGAGQERGGTAVLAVAEDRRTEGRHVRPQLVGAAGERFEREPGGAAAGVVDEAVFGDCCPALYFVATIFSPPAPPVFASGRAMRPSGGDGTPATTAQ